MSSYRPYPPPQSSYPPPPPPNQNPPQPPPSQQPPPPHRPNYNQNWGYPSRPPPPHQQYPYEAPPPPPPESSYPPPPPPPPPQQQQGGQPPMYYPPNQYSQSSMYNLQPPMQPLQPPLPPPPPGSSIPPPPPPPSSPPPPPPKESDVGDTGVSDHNRRASREGYRREHGHSRQQRPPVPPPQVGKNVNGGGLGRVETEEERRLRKKREYEKQRQEEKQRQQMKESQNAIMQKTHMMGAGKGGGGGGHGSIVGSRMGDRRATQFLGSERVENRLKKPTTFVCKMRFRNELPDPSAQPKFMFMKKDKDRFTRYAITSLEKEYKPQLYVEPDLGIPLDLLDLSVYNPPKGYVRPPLDPEDEELLRDDDVVTPVKKDGIRRKERPTDKGMSWLVKTQYISPLSMDSTRQSLTEKQAKELREMRGSHNPSGNRNSRGRQIKEIEATFEASKLPPVHATNKNLHPVEIMPLLPDFDRYEDQFVVASFDGAPTADSEVFGKFDQSVREAHESRAVMKSYVATGVDPANPEKFLAYMVPSVDEISKDMYDEDEETSFSWIREYHWDVQGDDVDDPATYLVSFDDGEARYVPLPTKLNLRKKRAREGRSNEEVEHFPVPARLTVRKRPTVAAIELKDSGVYSNLKGNASSSKMGKYDPEDEVGRSGRGARHQDLYHSSGAEDDMSE